MVGHKFEANLIYTGSSKIARTTLKKKKKNKSFVISL